MTNLGIQSWAIVQKRTGRICLFARQIARAAWVRSGTADANLHFSIRSIFLLLEAKSAANSFRRHIADVPFGDWKNAANFGTRAINGASALGIEKNAPKQQGAACSAKAAFALAAPMTRGDGFGPEIGGPIAPDFGRKMNPKGARKGWFGQEIGFHRETVFSRNRMEQQPARSGGADDAKPILDQSGSQAS